MSSLQPPLFSPSWRVRLVQAYDGLIPALGVLAGVLFVLMAFFIGIDVLLRNLAGGGIGWIIELMEYAMFVATALAAPWVLREGGHVSVDILNAQLPVRWRQRVLAMAAALGMLICAVVAWYSASAAWQAWERGSMIVKSFIFPDWWLNALVPVSMALMVIEFARLLRAECWPPAAPAVTSDAG